jgi:hypothetical protein
MWFIFITARLFISPSFQPRLAATLLRSCPVVNSLTRRAGLSPAFQPTSLAQPLIELRSISTANGKNSGVGSPKGQPSSAQGNALGKHVANTAEP